MSTCSGRPRDAASMTTSIALRRPRVAVQLPISCGRASVAAAAGQRGCQRSVAEATSAAPAPCPPTWGSMPERAGGTRAARSTAAARTGTATPQPPAATPATSAPGATPTTDQTAEQAQRMARAAVEKAAALGSGVARSVRTVVTPPVTATAAVVDDVVSAVRRPDAVLYGGALIGLAAFGILEWPVAAAVGVGVAVAGGVRRARS
jgi:hypothetical protein